LPIADLKTIGNRQLEIGNNSVSAVGQHRHHAIMIRLGDEHIDVQVTLSLVSLLRQYVSRMRMAPLDFSGGRQPHSLGRTFVRL